MKGRLLLILFLCLGMIFCSMVVMKGKISLSILYVPRVQTVLQNDLDGCRDVYIDMGTNIAIQIRKLYQPHLYPDAPVLPLFREVFGNVSDDVCSVGFEANPVHDSYLKEFEQFCREQHWRVQIFRSTAVSTEEKNGTTFYIEPKNNISNQWGASLYKGKDTSAITIPTINIVSYIRNVVLKRRIPSSSSSTSPPKVMIKSDIEGHDSIVLAHLILEGVYCSIDLIYAEHLTPQFRDSISFLQKLSASCPTKLIYLDDETYFNRRFPLTNNKSFHSNRL